MSFGFTENVISIGSFVALPLLIIVTFGVLATLAREIALALRAKRRAFYQMQIAAHREEKFHNLAKVVLNSDFDVSQMQIEELKREVEHHLAHMSKRDRGFVHQGLYQKSKLGSERYLKEVVGQSVLEAAA